LLLVVDEGLELGFDEGLDDELLLGME